MAGEGTPNGLNPDHDGMYGVSAANAKDLVRSKYGGYCMGETCISEMKKVRGVGSNYKYMVYNEVRVLKTTDKSRTHCVDCKQALYWDVIGDDLSAQKPTKRLKGPKRSRKRKSQAKGNKDV